MDMEQRLYSLEQRVGKLEEIAKQNAAAVSAINENIKALVIIGKTLRWVGMVLVGLWVLMKTGNGEQLMGLFK